MPFDYKKEYKEFYMPPKKPSIVEVPPMNYEAVPVGSSHAICTRLAFVKRCCKG